jgi:hypothetical protein
MQAEVELAVHVIAGVLIVARTDNSSPIDHTGSMNETGLGVIGALVLLLQLDASLANGLIEGATNTRINHDGRYDIGINPIKIYFLVKSK